MTNNLCKELFDQFFVQRAFFSASFNIQVFNFQLNMLFYK